MQRSLRPSLGYASNNCINRYKKYAYVRSYDGGLLQ